MQQTVCVRRKKTKKNEIPPHPNHSPLKMHFFSSGNSLWTFKAAATRKGDMSDMPNVQPTEQPLTFPPGSRGSDHIHASTSLSRMSAGVLCLASNGGALEACKNIEVGLVRSKIRLAWAVRYFTDQLTP